MNTDQEKDPMRVNRLVRSMILAGALVLAAGCSDDDSDNGGGPGLGAVPDFNLKDVNPNSVTANQTISPRNYLDQVSAWYFGQAT